MSEIIIKYNPKDFVVVDKKKVPVVIKHKKKEKSDNG
jgi:hypothetical protein